MSTRSNESYPASPAGQADTRLGSPDRFGYEWAHYDRILPESRVQLERWLGPLTLASFAGKRVLEVGCGMGRNPYWMLSAGARELLAVDVDEGSLTAARRNLSGFPQARVEQCSAYDLTPSRWGTFDRVTCIGVLHHLSEPERALDHMWSCVAPGGELVLWCYAKEGNRLLLPVISALRAVGSRAPIKLSHALAKGITAAAWPALRVAPFRTDYYRFLKTLSFRNVESIVFDQMLPRVAHYWTHKDMTELGARLPGGSPTLTFVQGNSWSLVVRKL